MLKNRRRRVGRELKDIKGQYLMYVYIHTYRKKSLDYFLCFKLCYMYKKVVLRYVGYQLSIFIFPTIILGRRENI